MLKRVFVGYKSVIVDQSRGVLIEHYSATYLRPAYWQAYRAVKKVPAGKLPWSVDNRRMAGEHGRKTLREILAVVEAAP